MFWSYLIGIAAASVGIYFFLALIGSELLGQLVLFVVGVAALAGLATAVSRLEEQKEKLDRLEEKLDRLLGEAKSSKPDAGEHSGQDEFSRGNE